MSGALRARLARGPARMRSVALGGDPSGRYWILAGHSNGWFRKGRLHVLAPPGGSAIADAW